MVLAKNNREATKIASWSFLISHPLFFSGPRRLHKNLLYLLWEKNRQKLKKIEIKIYEGPFLFGRSQAYKNIFMAVIY